MKRKSLLALVFVVLSLSVTAGYRQPAVKPAQNTITATIPFELVLRHIVLQVKVDNSRPLSFVFDTGDKVGVIDLDRARELGLKLKGQVRIGGAGSEQ